MAQKKYDSIEEAAKDLGLTEQLAANPEHFEPILKGLVKSAGGTARTSQTKTDLIAYGKDELGLELDGSQENVETLKIKIALELKEKDGADGERTKEFCEKFGMVFDEQGNLYKKKAGVKPVAERRSGMKEGTTGHSTLLVLGDDEYADKSYEELVEVLAAQGVTTTAKSIAWYANYGKKKIEAGDAEFAKAFGDDFEIIPRARKARSVTTAEGTEVKGTPLSLEDAYAKRQARQEAAKSRATAGGSDDNDNDGDDTDPDAEE